MLDGVQWKATENEADDSGLPYATHSGVFEMFGKKMRCYRLNTGQAVFDADDFAAFFAELSDDEVR